MGAFTCTLQPPAHVCTPVYTRTCRYCPGGDSVQNWCTSVHTRRRPQAFRRSKTRLLLLYISVHKHTKCAQLHTHVRVKCTHSVHCVRRWFVVVCISVHSATYYVPNTSPRTSFTLHQNKQPPILTSAIVYGQVHKSHR